MRLIMLSITVQPLIANITLYCNVDNGMINDPTYGWIYVMTVTCIAVETNEPEPEPPESGGGGGEPPPEPEEPECLLAPTLEIGNFYMKENVFTTPKEYYPSRGRWGNYFWMAANIQNLGEDEIPNIAIDYQRGVNWVTMNNYEQDGYMYKAMPTEQLHSTLSWGARVKARVECPTGENVSIEQLISVSMESFQPSYTKEIQGTPQLENSSTKKVYIDCLSHQYVETSTTTVSATYSVSWTLNVLTAQLGLTLSDQVQVGETITTPVNQKGYIGADTFVTNWLLREVISDWKGISFETLDQGFFNERTISLNWHKTEDCGE